MIDCIGTSVPSSPRSRLPASGRSPPDLSMRSPASLALFPRPSTVVVWLSVALFLVWITKACLLGHVEHELSTDHMRGRGPAVYSILPAPPPFWPAELRLEVLENGQPLAAGPELPRVTIKDSGPGSPQFSVLRFIGSDGSDPRDNGRKYVVRAPRRQRPAALALLMVCWIGLPWAAIRFSKRVGDGSEPGTLGPAIWCAGLSVLAYSLFALQAWLPQPNAPWLVIVAAVCAASWLVRLGSGPRPPMSGWLPWLLGLVAWALCSSLGGTAYSSPTATASFVVMAVWGLMIHDTLRGSLRGHQELGPSLLLVVFVILSGLSLARDAGFDLAGQLAWLGLSSVRTNAIGNPWTTKFLGHWVLVVAWCTLVVLGRAGRPRQLGVATVVLLTGLALGISGSKAALVALVFSAVVGVAAYRWPTTVRRFVVASLAVAIVLAPLLAAAPWRLHTAASSVVPSDGSLRLEMDIRGGIWEFSRRLISQHPLEGWGFGASASLPGRELPIADALKVEPSTESSQLTRHPALAGGHPHNAALLIWMDLGLVGALLVTGLLIATGKSISALEENRQSHAALLGLLTVTAVYLAFNYPVWEPEVLSLLWMTLALASAGLPARPVALKPLLRSGTAVVVLLALGCAVLAHHRLSRWQIARDFPPGEVTLDLAAGHLLRPGRDQGRHLPLRDEPALEAGAELVGERWIRGWAFGPPGAESPKAVLVFVGPSLVGIAWPERPSPEAFSRVEVSDVQALTAGFLVPVDPDRIDFQASVFVVVVRNGEALVKTLPPLDTPSSERRKP